MAPTCRRGDSCGVVGGGRGDVGGGNRARMGDEGVLAQYLFPSRRAEAGWRLTSAIASELFSYTRGPLHRQLQRCTQSGRGHSGRASFRAQSRSQARCDSFVRRVDIFQVGWPRFTIAECCTLKYKNTVRKSIRSSESDTTRALACSNHSERRTCNSSYSRQRSAAMTRFLRAYALQSEFFRCDGHLTYILSFIEGLYWYLAGPAMAMLKRGGRVRSRWLLKNAGRYISAKRPLTRWHSLQNSNDRRSDRQSASQQVIRISGYSVVADA